jgi:lipopolysaccharide export system permease protein
MHFRDKATRNVTIGYYDEARRTATAVVVEEFGSTAHPRLRWVLEAPSMKWIEGRGWVADSMRRRTFDAEGMEITWLRNAEVPFTIRQDEIRRLQLTIGELTFDEVLNYVNTLRAGGKNTRRYEIDYYAGWAFPFANAIVVLIAVPFASVRRKAGIAVNVAAAMVIAFLYIAFSEISKAVGAATTLDPMIVGWSANIIFAAIGVNTLYMFRR